MFFYKDNMLYQSRLYPADSSEPMDQYRNLVQKAMALCLGQPNLWKLITKRDELKDYCESARAPAISRLQILRKRVAPEICRHYGYFVIGAPSLCVCCGQTFKSGWLKAAARKPVVCRDCEETVPIWDARYIDGAYHCRACLHICAVCGHAVNGTMYPAFDQRGNMMETARAVMRRLWSRARPAVSAMFVRSSGTSSVREWLFPCRQEVRRHDL